MNMRIFQELSSKHQFGLYTKELTHQVAQKNIIYIYVVDKAHGNDYLGKKKVQANLPIQGQRAGGTQAKISANLGRLGRPCQLLSPKGVLFFNFLIVSHVVTICTIGPILVDLLELFLAQVIIAMNCGGNCIFFVVIYPCN